MIILGLGTNIDNRLHFLRNAVHLLKKIPTLSILQISPIYISDALLPENAPDEWNVPYLNLAVRCQANLSPNELLQHTKKIEQLLGRKPGERWGPRVIDIDILAWGDLIQYDEKLHIPHKNLHERPFALWPLADVAPFWVYPFPGNFQGKTAAEIAEQWGSRFSGEAPFRTKQIAQRIDTPQLIGILNVTPDSFSDGGNFLAAENAISQAKKLVAAGAEIIDIGAEATGPIAKPITPEEEWLRLENILMALFSEKDFFPITPKISIDTRHASVAKKALALGAHWINDISGLDDKEMRDLIANQDCDVVFMHHLSIPEDRRVFLPREKNPVTAVHQWAKTRIQFLEDRGISRERLIFDVGIGYGKLAEQSLALLKQMDVFSDLGVRLLVGHSRKSFLQQFTDLPAGERDVETLVLSLFLARKVDYLRVHDVGMHARGMRVFNSLSSTCGGEGWGEEESSPFQPPSP